jgi:3-hydroxyisobutyrate dehydrogenase
MASETGIEIGWIGTGVIGAPMAGHLLAAGHRVSVFNRTHGRADELVARGARWRDSPAEVARGADVVCMMLGTPADLREVALGEGGVLDAMGAGSLLIDFTTSEPALAVEIHAAAAGRGVQSLDAPVSGGDVGARNASLVIMVGGAADAFARAPDPGDAGRHGAARGRRRCRAAHQDDQPARDRRGDDRRLRGADLRPSRRPRRRAHAGDDLRRRRGLWSLSNYGPRVLRGDLEPGFKIDHFVKDLGIALDEARRMGVALPGAALAQQLYIALQGQGQGQRGTHALALARLSGLDWPRA